MTDIPVRSFSSTRQEHLNDHNTYRCIANSAIYSNAFGSLQEAIDEAQAQDRPLIISPGAYSLTAGMLIDGGYDLHVSAYGAIFNAAQDMGALLEIKDSIRCTWRGGWFNVPTGRAVDNAVYNYRNSVQATRNSLYDVTIEGDYSTGLRIGKQSDGGQCDHMYLTNIETVGRSLSGQVGVHIGTGVYGNCLNTTVNNLMCSNNETHVKIDATNAYIDGAFFDTCTQDIIANTTAFSIRGVRSEDGQRFFVTPGTGSFPAHLTIEDVIWNGEQIASDGEWMRLYYAGSVYLKNVAVRNPASAAKIVASPSAPLMMSIDGLTGEELLNDAISKTSDVTLKGSYVKVGSGGNVESVSIV